MRPQNIFALSRTDLPEELVEVLAEGEGNVKIERIVSRGHASPNGFWYDQETTEFVVLLRGSASLRFEDEEVSRELQPGDWLEIAKGRRHRVDATSADEDTVWLAVHWA